MVWVGNNKVNNQTSPGTVTLKVPVTQKKLCVVGISRSINRFHEFQDSRPVRGKGEMLHMNNPCAREPCSFCFLSCLCLLFFLSLSFVY
jgi:hypothetical protein